MSSESVDPGDPLLERLAAGDRSALDELFEANRARLRRVVQFRIPPILQRRIDADDIVQDAYLAAERRIASFEADYSGFVWLRMILMQTLKDAYRHHVHAEKRGAEREITAAFARSTDSAAMSNYFVASTTSPSLALERADRRARLEAVLEELSAADREILVLRHFEEVSNREAAEVLGLTPRVTASRYEKALRRLSLELMSDDPDGSD